MKFGKKALGRATKSVSNSRVGKELKLSGKVLILGTHAMYSMMDPDTDPISWAYSYTDDVEQLMQETDEVMRMDGPSITGKNTVIEDLVNSAYEASFD